VYEARLRDLAQDDYSTGSIAVTQDSTAVVGTGTTFTANMVGRSLKVNDGSPDGIWYKIASFTDATHITLENVYEGNAGSGKSYLIGELPDIPEFPCRSRGLRALPRIPPAPGREPGMPASETSTKP
jgi:hypothetical protein